METAEAIQEALVKDVPSTSTESVPITVNISTPLGLAAESQEYDSSSQGSGKTDTINNSYEKASPNSDITTRDSQVSPNSESSLSGSFQPNRKKRGHSEWLEKALEEGGASKRRSRTSKKISDPDFVFTDPVLARDKSTTPTKEMSPTNVSTTSKPTTSSKGIGLPDLDYENMSHYEKFYKYKKEYKKWRTQNSFTKPKRKREILVDPDSPGPSTRDQRGSAYSTRQSPRIKKADESASLSKDSDQKEDMDPNLDFNLENIVVLDKDKYCWYCHKEVTESQEADKKGVEEKRCQSCWKIFHVRCDVNYLTEGESQGDKWECKHCIEYRNLKENDLWAPYVQYLGYDKYIKQIRFIIDKLKKYPSAKEFLQPVNARQFPDYRLYIAHPVDFEQIERRLRDGEYRTVDTLYEDFKWMFHNSVIFNGNSSAITKDLRGLLRYLRMDLYDLDACACCYIHAYTRPEAWFILPCPSPHLLVWAQLKGFPYWPAKVYDSPVEQRPGEILVKFFGDHARSWIPFESIYLYSLDPPSTCPSRKKKKHSMIPSLVEMDKHIELLKKQFGVFKYPEQDILIGTNVSERALQLKYMLPSCNTILPIQPCTIEKTSRALFSKKEDEPESIGDKDPKTDHKADINDANIIPSEAIERPMTRRSIVKSKPGVIDMNDATCKRSLLSRLEERMQQYRSDSEDGHSVKSQSLGTETRKVESYRQNSKAARSVRCQMFFKVLERKVRKEERKRRRMRRSSVRGGSSGTRSPEKGIVDTLGDESTSDGQRTDPMEGDGNIDGSKKEEGKNNDTQQTEDKKTEKSKESENSTEVGRKVTEEDVKTDGKIVKGTNDEAVENTSANSLKSTIKKPSCGDIDQFIETHLATQPTPEWDVSKIPPILSRDEDNEEEEEESLAMVAATGGDSSKDDSTLNGNLHKKEVTSDNSTNVPSTPTKILDEIINKVENVPKTPIKVLNEIVQKIDSDLNKITDEKIKIVGKKIAKKRISKQKSLSFKKRLFRHKKYSTQLFELRKLTHEMKKRVQESFISPSEPEEIISKYFVSEDVKITSPSVNLTSLSVKEMREMKRNVKLSKNKGHSRMNVGDRSKSTDAEFVPIEDTMIISMDSEDLNSYSCNSMEPVPALETGRKLPRAPQRTALSYVIDEVAQGKFDSNPDFNRLKAKKSLQKNFNFKAAVKKERLSVATWRKHMLDISLCLKDMPKPSARRADNMLHDVLMLKKMTEQAVGLDLQHAIAVDTQYSAALTTAELVLYSEYTMEYNPPILTADDYDDVGCTSTKNSVRV